jgi:hypothetical protein
MEVIFLSNLDPFGIEVEDKRMGLLSASVSN